MIYNILFIFLIFASAIEVKIPLFNYWDEIFTIAILCYGISRSKFKLKKSSIRTWLWLGILIIFGLLGNIVYPGLQESRVTIIKDIFAIAKFFIIAYALKDLVLSPSKNEIIIKNVARISKILIVFTFAIAIFGYFINIGVYTGEVRLVKCFKFVFSVPTFFVSSYVMLAAILIAESSNKNKLYLLLDCALLYLSQRTKGYAAIVLILIFLLLGEKKLFTFVRKIGESKRITASKGKLAIVFTALVGAAFAIGKSKIDEYLIYGMTAARPALYMVGLNIATDFFPLGSGFGTFASSLSTESYSRVYSIYGISGVLGLVEGNASFAADVFWPCIYGQFGIIGFFVYTKNMWSIIKSQLFFTPDAKRKVALFFLWFYALIASTSEAYFTNSSGVQFIMVACLFLGANYSRKVNE